MRIEILKTTRVDAHTVAERMTDRHRAEIAATMAFGVDDIAPALAGLYEGGVCARANGVPVAIGEVFTARPNIASLGLITTDGFAPAALKFTKFLRDGLFVTLRAGGVHRIECLTMADFTAAHRWIKLLGLREEATLRKYGSGGEDFIQFAWTAP